MTGRILLAGLLGAIAMYAWATLAHTVLGLGEIGIKTMATASEQTVFDSVKTATGDQSGLYMGPVAAMKTMTGSGPRLTMVYLSNGSYALQPIQMVGEFVLELVQSLILAFLLAGMMASLGARIGWSVAAGVMVGIATNGSYHIWYGFPHDYTLAQIATQVVEYLVAGTVIALVLGNRTRAAA